MSDKPDELEGQTAITPGVVALASAAIMDDVRNVAGRIEAHGQKENYRQSSFVPGQVETIDFPQFGAITATTRDDRELGFPAHSVIVDNPTTLWIYVPAAQRFASPGLVNAVWQIPKASTKAEIIARAPAGIVQAAVGVATQATFTFCEAWLMPTPGIVGSGLGLVAANGQNFGPDNADNEAVSATNLDLITKSRLYAFDSATWDRLRTLDAFGGAFPAGIQAIMQPGVDITAASGNKANAAAIATLAAIAGKTTYIIGFQITAAGSTAALDVLVTVVGVITGTLTFIFTFPVGALIAATPLLITFARPIPANAQNTAIVVTLPAGGLGNTNAAAVAQGFQL